MLVGLLILSFSFSSTFIFVTTRQTILFILGEEYYLFKEQQLIVHALNISTRQFSIASTYSNSSKQLYNFDKVWIFEDYFNSNKIFFKVLQNTTSGSHKIIPQLQIQQGTSSAILTQGQILNPQNIIVVSSNTVGAVDASGL